MAFLRAPLLRKRSGKTAVANSYDVKNRMRKKDFRDYEFYYIEMQGDEKIMHINNYVWKNDGWSEYRDANGNLVVKPYTYTEYTFCCIPVKEIEACKTSSEVWDLINDYECNVKQYERGYTWKELLEASAAYPGSPHQYLHPCDITMNTPCGNYFYYVG